MAPFFSRLQFIYYRANSRGNVAPSEIFILPLRNGNGIFRKALKAHQRLIDQIDWSNNYRNYYCRFLFVPSEGDS